MIPPDKENRPIPPGYASLSEFRAAMAARLLKVGNGLAAGLGIEPLEFAAPEGYEEMNQYQRDCALWYQVGELLVYLGEAMKKQALE